MGTPEILARSELFRNLDSSALHYIESLATNCHYRRKEFICFQGTPITNMRVLCSGRAKYSYSSKTGEQLLFGWLNPGAAFSMCVFGAVPTAERVTVQAVDNTETMEWSVAAVAALSIRYPTLVTNAVSVLLIYWDRVLTQLDQLRTRSVPLRVAWVIDEAAREVGDTTTGGVEVVISDEEIADLASTTVFTVSRLIQQWSKLGLLVKTRGRILIPRGTRIQSYLGPIQSPVSIAR